MIQNSNENNVRKELPNIGMDFILKCSRCFNTNLNDLNLVAEPYEFDMTIPY